MYLSTYASSRSVLAQGELRKFTTLKTENTESKGQTEFPILKLFSQIAN